MKSILIFFCLLSSFINIHEAQIYSYIFAMIKKIHLNKIKKISREFFKSPLRNHSGKKFIDLMCMQEWVRERRRRNSHNVYRRRSAKKGRKEFIFSTHVISLLGAYVQHIFASSFRWLSLPSSFFERERERDRWGRKRAKRQINEIPAI